MKINFIKSLNKNKPIRIHSVFYPAPGYVAIPENKPSEFKEKKHNKKIKSRQQEPGSIAGMIKQFLYYISICKNRERG